MKKTKAARRNAVLNVVMVVAIVLIVAAGVLAVSSFKGEPVQPEVIAAAPTPAAETVLPEESAAPIADETWVEGKTGFANITRKGISYQLEDGTRLRDGDIVETLNAASITIVNGENRVTLDENARVQIALDEAGMLTLELNNGTVFADIAQPFTMTLGGETLTASAAVFAASAPYGSAGAYMLAGEAKVGAMTARAGYLASIVAGDVTLGELDAAALSAFELSAARSAADAGRALCFTASELDEVQTARERARQDALQAQLLAEQSEEAIERERQENEERVREALAAKNQTTTTAGTAGEGNLDYADIVVEKPTCTIEIRCDTILDNMDKLTEGKNAYVPANGCLLAASRVSFDEGETAYDVLARACSVAGIALESSWTPMYNSYYVEGIGNLYEFDCGEQSGWMYKVNGWFPNYGASSYTLSDGDSIVFIYTCNGYGADVGGGVG